MTIKTYNVGDQPSRAEFEELGIKHRIRILPSWSQTDKDGYGVRAVKTDQFREPKKGEWYLSGAIPEAYRAPNDLGAKYHIAKLVAIHRKTSVTETIVKVAS